MKRLLLIFCIVIFAACHILAQGWNWAKSEGSTSVDEIERVAVDPDGNVIVAGKFSGSFMYENVNIASNGGKDILVAKYSSAGTFQWVRTAGGTADDEGLSVETDIYGNVLVTGFYTGNATFGSLSLTGTNTPEIFIAKYNPSGTIQWVNKGWGPGEDRGKGIDSDTKGNVLVTGFYKDTCYFNGITLVSPGEDNVFLAKYSPSGAFLWVADGGGPYSAWASSVSTDDYDNAYVTGSFKDTAVFDNDTIVSYGGNDVFLLKADSLGNWTWAINNGGIDNDYGNGIEVDPQNNIAVTGSFFQTVYFAPNDTMVSIGGKDGFAAYYDPQGNCLWARNMGGTAEDKAIDISTDKDGNIYVTGYIKGIASFGNIVDTSAGGDDIFIAKYDQQGMIKKADLAGGTSNEYGKGIQVDVQGVAYVAGYFEGTCYVGTTPLVSAGSRDLWVAKYYDGSPVFTTQPQDVSVCEGDTVTLSVQVTGPGTFSYLWFDEAGSILGAVNSTYTFIAADTNYSGKYFCMVHNSFGGVTSDTAFVTVNPKPYVYLGPDTDIWIFDSIYLDAGSGYASYQWSTGDTASAIVLYGYQIFPSIEIIVSVTSNEGCNNSDTINIVVIIDEVEESYLNSLLKIYPNPASDQFTIISQGLGLHHVEIYNPSGEICKSIDLKGIRYENISISVAGLETGLYYIRIKAEEGIAVRKLIIKN